MLKIICYITLISFTIGKNMTKEIINRMYKTLGEKEQIRIMCH